jgi:hypothetical protein
MNNDNQNEDSRAGDAMREEVLVGRVVDHEASAGDWAELERLALVDTGVWERLASAQRAHARLSAAVEDYVAVSELVELDALRPRRDIAGTIGRFGGWAIAASLAVAWGMMATMGGAPTTPVANNNANNAALVPTDPAQGGPFDVSYISPDEAENQWIGAKLRAGQPVTEFPGELLEVRATKDGEYRIVVLRKFMEERRVKDMSAWRILEDDHGNVVRDELDQPVVVPSEPPPAFVGEEPI